MRKLFSEVCCDTFDYTYFHQLQLCKPTFMQSTTFPIRAIILTLFTVALLSTTSKAQNSNGWTASFDSDRSFIENKGQFYVREGKTSDKPVLYGIDISFSRIFFHQNGVTFNFTQKLRPLRDERHSAEKEASTASEQREEELEERRAVLRTDEVGYTWEGANPNCEIIAEDIVPQYYSYSFYSGGKEKTEYFIKGYKKLTYKNIYPNIDIEYTIHPENGIKYCIIVRPGGEISKVRMKYDGRPETDLQGNVRIGSLFGDIIDHAPVTFYADETSKKITSWYIADNSIVTFGVGECDWSKTIIIDPWTQTPSLPNSNKVWECETNSSGEVFAYGGDSFIKLIKYNAAGAIQWTYTSPWDSANYWIGGFIAHPTSGETYMTSGSNGEIIKITTAGTVAWNNNPNGLTSYEYWSLTFSCDLTQLIVGGSRLQFAFPSPILRGVMININLANGAQSGVTIVGYGSTMSIPPSIQEVSSVCYGPNNKLYFLTLDTVGCIDNALSAISFKVPTSYAFDYYIPGYGFGTKQPISAIRTSPTALYTMSGTTIHKRDLNTGAVLATAAIPGGTMTPTFGGRFVNGNGGIDIDATGNVFVGTTTGVVKFDANLNVISTSATTFAVYDVDVNNNGEVIACGWSGGTGTVQSINMSAGAQIVYSCISNTPLSVTSVQTNISCFGQCTGTATVSASGGTGPYSYAWAPSGGNAASATGLCVGTYTCTVTDGLGATTTATFNITQPASALSATGSSTNPNCSGGTGSATVTASGGTAGYTYAWIPSGGNSSTATGLAANNYTCTVTDANGCTTTQTFNITVPTAITGTTTSTPATCGNNNGSASVTASGGTGGLTYAWAPSGGNSSTASNITGGNYTVTVTDANGCTNSFTVNVPTTGGPTTSVQSFGDVTCFGGNDGTGTISASGNGPFTYSWAPIGGSAATATNLTAQVYTVTVTDINGCSSTQTVSISEPTAITPTITAFTDATCGNNDGSATASASGGTGAFTYSWAPSGGNAATANNIGAGIYTVTVTDANNCTTTTTVSISNIGAPVVTTQALTNVSCFSLSDGSATVSATGSGPFTYNWAPTGGNAASATNLAQGVYTVTVTDNGGCTAIHTLTITQPTQITGTITPQDATCGNSNGTASITPTGGTGPYTYAWSNSQTTQQITGLAAGSYSVIVTDANGCTTTATATILNSGAPTIQVTSQSDPTCFSGTNGTATIVATGGTGPYTYNWSPSGGTASSATGLGAGTYTVTVTGSDGCTQTQTIALTSPTAILSTTSSTPDDCNSSNGSAAISVSGGTPGYVLAWSTGSSNDTITGLSAGSYTCTVTDANGCTTSTTVLVGTSGSVTANAGVDVTILQGQTTPLTGTGGITWTWTPAGSLDCSNCQNPNATPSVTTTYILTVTDSLGCTDTDTVVVFVDIECGDLFLPTAFSPNGDGENDEYCVRSNCIKTLQFEIYNRWGEKVFGTSDPDICWDGTWREKPCEAAVFTYFIRGEMIDGTPIEGQGNITLVK